VANDVQLCRKSGSKGGKTTAQLHGPDFCERRAQLGGQSLVLRYGKNYMRALVLRRYQGKKNG
jgi:hypothetical protein